MAVKLPHLIIDAKDGQLLLRQERYSSILHKILIDLPRKEWRASEKTWYVPLTDLGLVQRHFAGVRTTLTPAAGAHVTGSGGELFASDACDTPLPDLGDYQFRTKPYDHQVRATAKCVSKRAFALLMEMGTGKTKAAIDALSYQMQRGRIQGALIICPKAVLFNWEREIATHSPLPAELRRTVVLTGAADKKESALLAGWNTCSFFITNYETTLRLKDELMGLVHKRQLAVVCDESTEIKNPKAKTSKAIHSIGLVSPARMILTGSPITQSPLDAFSQFYFLDRNILGHLNFTSFKAEYAMMAKLPFSPVPVVTAYRNLDRLAALLAPHSYRVLKKDCLDLPPKVYRTVELEMGPKQRGLYTQMRDESVVEVGGRQLAAPVVLTRLLRLQQMASGFLPDVNDFGETVGEHSIPDAPKLRACLEVVEEAIASEQKVIIWCRFLWELNALLDTLDEKYGAVTYEGKVSTADRQATVDRFQDDPECKVFIGQIQTGGIGITLTAASTVIYYSNSFSLSDRLQSEDRAHRIGQSKSVTIIDLIMRGTVDVTIQRALRDKKDLADVVTGDNFREAADGSLHNA